MAYLPVLPATKARVNDYLAGMAARGFGVDEAMLRQACRTSAADLAEPPSPSIYHSEVNKDRTAKEDRPCAG